MAVGGVINETVAHKIWYAWNHGNAGKVTAEDYAAVKAQYGDQFATWEAQVENDEVDYDFNLTDEEITSARQEGKDKAEETSGFDGEHQDGKSTGQQVVNYACTAVAAGAAAAIALLTKGVTICGKSIKNGFLALAGAAVLTGLAQALNALKPNEKETEVLNTAKVQEYKAVEESLQQAQEDAFDAAEEANEKAEEAEEENDAANDAFKENEATYSSSNDRYQELLEKIANGEGLTDEEIEELKALQEEMQGGVDSNNDIMENTSDVVNGLYDEIGELTATFDDAQTEIERDNGVIDFFKQFDEETLKSTENVAASQKVFAAASFGFAATSGVLGAAKIASLFTTAEGFAYLGAVGGGILAGTTALGQASHQADLGNQVSEAIDVRKDMEDLSSDTSDVVDQNFGEMNYSLDFVDDLEMDIPKDMVPPEGGDDAPNGDEGVPGVTGGDGDDSGTTSGTDEDDDKKVKEVDNGKKS